LEPGVSSGKKRSALISVRHSTALSAPLNVDWVCLKAGRHHRHCWNIADVRKCCRDREDWLENVHMQPTLFAKLTTLYLTALLENSLVEWVLNCCCIFKMFF